MFECDPDALCYAYMLLSASGLWLSMTLSCNCSHRFVVQPEWHPWHHDNHESRNVVGDDVEGQLPLEYHVNSQATVLSWQQRKLGEILERISQCVM